MKNFAEELVYWYLRFNGFFPLTNFVLHREDLKPRGQNADVDLVAIRQKFVSEEIGAGHIDTHLFQHFDLSKNIGLMCEVKSGRNFNANKVLLKREERISYCLKRIGFFSEEKVEYHTNVLKSEFVSPGNFHEVGKLLVTRRQENVPGFICLSMNHIEQFIVERIRLFPNAKDGAKLHFNSEMLQYIIWKNNI